MLPRLAAGLRMIRGLLEDGDVSIVWLPLSVRANILLIVSPFDCHYNRVLETCSVLSLGIDLLNKNVLIDSKILCNFTSKFLTIRRLSHLHGRGKRALEEGRHDETGKDYCNDGTDAGNVVGST
jgi:hypothetical protein